MARERKPTEAEVIEADAAETVEMTTDADAEPQKTQQVRYVGGAGTRVFYKEDWARVGIEGPEVRWEWPDHLAVPREELDFLSEEQFNRYIRDDGSFVVEDVA